MISAEALAAEHNPPVQAAGATATATVWSVARGSLVSTLVSVIKVCQLCSVTRGDPVLHAMDNTGHTSMHTRAQHCGRIQESGILQAIMRRSAYSS